MGVGGVRHSPHVGDEAGGEQQRSSDGQQHPFDHLPSRHLAPVEALHTPRQRCEPLHAQQPDADVLNADGANGFAEPVIDSTPFECTLEALDPVKLALAS